MAFDTERSAEELVIRLKEAALRQNLNAIRICLVAMAGFGLLAFSLRTASTGNADQFLSLVMGSSACCFLGCLQYHGYGSAMTVSCWLNSKRLLQV